MNIRIDLLSAVAERQMARHQIIANNLSNVRTAGYRREIPVFSNLISQALSPAEQAQSASLTSFEQGDIETTGNVLDLAIEGEGFFKIMTPGGIRYSRSGVFRLDGEGRLTTAAGDAVQGRQGEIRIAGKEIIVERNGALRVDGQETDRLALITFPDPSSLRREGGGLFSLEGRQQEQEVEAPVILQGHLEMSNVNQIEEMVNLIDALRTYEAYSKVIQYQDELKGKIVNDLGRV